MKTPKSREALRVKAEAVSLNEPSPIPQDTASLSAEEAKKLLHELQVHQIELEMQNEELRRSHAELDVSRARYFDLYDLAPVGYCTLDADGIIIESNLMVARMLGLPRIQLTKQPLARFILSEDQDTFYRYRRALVGTGSAPAIELRMLNKNSTPFWVLLEATAVKGDDGMTTFRMMLIDITDRKRAEESLQQASKNWQATFDAIGDSMLLLTPDHHILEMNRAALSAVGKKREEVVGQKCFCLFHGTDAPIPGCPCEKAMQTHEYGATEYTDKGQMFELLAWPIEGEDGRIKALAHLVRNITARRKSEEALGNMQKLESLGLLAGGIAHDFNNLMGGIFGYIDLALEKSTDEKTRRYLAKAVNTIDRARGLTAQLLTFAKGGAPIQQVTPLFPFVQEAAQFALSGSNVSCRFDIADGLPSCNVDKTQISQVFDNIVINAKQAMPVGGTITVTARNVSVREKEHPILKTGGYVKVSVKDSGIGIQPDLLPRIFDPFFTTKTTGHGLGLATCYSIINRHRGCIDVESEPGKGSTFHVFLPAAPESAPAAVPALEAKHRGNGTILLMEDEEVMRETIGEMLESLGYSVVCRDTGSQAVDFFKTGTTAGRTFTALIFDLTVPGAMGGKEAVAEVRKLDTAVPVFVASGYADDPVMINPADYGFTASICKPFTKAELAAMLERCLKA